jgi:NAD+ kinase
MLKIGFIYKEEDKKIKDSALKIIKKYSKKYKFIKNESDMKKCDFILTLGGDGTLLRASKIAIKLDKLILSIHLGGLGILTEIRIDKLEESLEKVEKKNFIIDKRRILEARIIGKDKKIKSFTALNDFVIKGERARTVRLEIYQDNLFLGRFLGDGVIVSSASGSTAYNYAANGPILFPQSSHYMLTPICSHQGVNRPIVLSLPSMIKLIKGPDTHLTIDGQKTFPLKEKSDILIRVSKLQVKFIRFKQYDLWKILGEKLGWN